MIQANMAYKYDEAIACLSARIRQALVAVDNSIKNDIAEIRIRIGRPVLLICSDRNLFLTETGRTCAIATREAITPEKSEIEESYRIICGYSVHSHQNETLNGYITVTGGHRAGICGTATASDDKIIGIRNISSINLRIARQINGCANEIVKNIYKEKLQSVIVAGAPSTGKTTILRDLSRQLSSGHAGEYYKVVIVDERGEMAAVYNGRPQNDIGINVDVLDGYPKASAIMIAVRTLSPDIIICDEIGDMDEMEAIKSGFNSGVKFAISAHAGSIKELLLRPQSQHMLAAGVFDKIITLKSRKTPGSVNGIYNAGDLLDKVYRNSTDSVSVYSNWTNAFPKSDKESVSVRADGAYAGAYRG